MYGYLFDYQLFTQIFFIFFENIYKSPFLIVKLIVGEHPLSIFSK
jgi:hypothetical protein